MKYLKYVVFMTILAIVAFACQEQIKVEPNVVQQATSNGRVEEFVEIEIPAAFKTVGEYDPDLADDVTEDVMFTFVNGTQVEGQIRLIMPDDETLAYFAVTPNILEAGGLEPDFLVKAAEGARFSLSQCFDERGCNDMERGQGRGGCRLSCWVDKAVDLAETIVGWVRGGNNSGAGDSENGGG